MVNIPTEEKTDDAKSSIEDRAQQIDKDWCTYYDYQGINQRVVRRRGHKAGYKDNRNDKTCDDVEFAYNGINFPYAVHWYHDSLWLK